MFVNYDRIIPEEDIVGRVFRPDPVGGFVYVARVYHSPEGKEGKTVADCIPIPPDKEHLIRVDFGQLRVNF